MSAESGLTHSFIAAGEGKRGGVEYHLEPGKPVLITYDQLLTAFLDRVDSVPRIRLVLTIRNKEIERTGGAGSAFAFPTFTVYHLGDTWANGRIEELYIEVVPIK